MKKIRFLLVAAVGAIVMLTMGAGLLSAQFGKRLGEAVGKAAEKAVTRKAEDTTTKAVDAALDPETYSGDGDDGGGSAGGGAQPSGGSQQSGGGNQSSQSGSSGNQQAAAAKPAQAPQAGANTVEIVYAKSDFVSGDEIFFDDDVTNEKLGEFPSQWDLDQGNAEVASLDGVKVISLIKYTSIVP